MRKITIKKIIITLVLVGIVWCVERAYTIEHRVQTHLEQTLTELIGVPVNMNKVELSILSGKGEIDGFTVSNPPGYSTDSAFKMDFIAFDFDVLSAFTRPLVINRLIVDSPHANLEIKENLSSNLQQIAGASLRQNKASEQNEQPETSQQQTAQSGYSVTPTATAAADKHYPVMIENLQIRNIRFKVSSGEDVWEDTVELVEMHDIGGEQGFSSRQLGHIVIENMTSRVLAEAAKQTMPEKAKQTIRRLGETLLKLLQNQNKAE